MTIHYADDRVTLHHGDALNILRTIPDASIDAVVTDPPYGLEFMGKAWDSFGGERNEGARGGAGDKGILPGYGRGGTNADVVRFKARGASAFQEWCELWAVECLRVLKPGGHLLAFGGSRTWHRLASAVEDAGFEIRDSIAWLYGSGFPKSLDVSKAITGTPTGHGSNSGAIRRATMGDDYEPSGVRGNRDGVTRRSDTGMAGRDLALTPDAKAWQGWGTALKPAFEPIVVGRKPLVGTVAGNILTHGTGAINIDGCRVGMSDVDRAAARVPMVQSAGGIYGSVGQGRSGRNGALFEPAPAGRWPANVVLDDTQAAALDQQTGNEESRFFPTFRYQAKAPTRERVRTDDGVAHPTVKPLDLMRWLVRLITPPGGVVLEPFAGSGTTVEACLLEGFRCVAIEREADYLPLIAARMNRATPTTVELDDTPTQGTLL